MRLCLAGCLNRVPDAFDASIDDNLLAHGVSDNSEQPINEEKNEEIEALWRSMFILSVTLSLSLFGTESRSSYALKKTSSCRVPFLLVTIKFDVKDSCFEDVIH